MNGHHGFSKRGAGLSGGIFGHYRYHGRALGEQRVPWPREVQRGPERPREVQKDPEMLREAQRGPRRSGFQIVFLFAFCENELC